MPDRLLRAWVLSILFHFSTITLLGLTLQPAPRGAADEAGGGLGIVLQRAGGAGDSNNGEDAPTEEIVVEQAPPIESLPVLPQLPLATKAEPVAPKSPPPTTPRTASSVGSGQPDAGHSSGGGRGAAGGSGDARVSVFGVQGSGSKFVYLFDRSSSMDGPPLAAAKKQLIESVSSLKSAHRFHIIFFNTRTQAFEVEGEGRRVAFATDRNKKLAANFVGGITADGGTDRLAALHEAIGLSADVIFFLTDADDPMTPSELGEVGRANGRAGAAICVIEFGRRQSPLPNNFLAELARQSGGQYGYVNTTTLEK
jgi:hypothetical protein